MFLTSSDHTFIVGYIVRKMWCLFMSFLNLFFFFFNF